MPNYIDKDKLKRDLIDNRSFYPAIVKSAIENAPTCDVVPRSEVEGLKKENEVLSASNKTLALTRRKIEAELIKAKQDVAREIFEEIEEGVKAAVSALQFENNPVHRNVKHNTYSSFMCFVKNIEKKYIGE